MTFPANTAHLFLAHHRVLVVDDEPLNLQVFEFNFGTEFSLLFANDAEEALAILREQRVAVVVADHRMPGMLGLDLLTWVAEHQPQVVRILLTAHSDVPLLLDATNRGILFRYVPKPWDADTMRQDMILAIERHLMEDEHQRLQAAAGQSAHAPAAVAAALLGDLEPLALELASAANAIDAGDNTAAVERLERAHGALASLNGDLRRAATTRARPFAPVDLNELCLAALQAVRARIDSLGVALEIALDTKLPRTSGARDDLVEATLALLRNALDALERTSGTRRLRLSSEATEDGWVRVDVTDGGPGFGGVALERASRSFFSAADRPGLGLAVARAVTLAHGGRFTVHDAAPGEGARVSMLLPPEAAE